MSCAPAPSSTWCSAKTSRPAPPRHGHHGHDGAAGADPAPDTGPAGVRQAGSPAGHPDRALGTAAAWRTPGELSGLGPVDPWLAPTPVRAAARNPATTWCVTVTTSTATPSATAAAGPNPNVTGNAPGPAAGVLLHPGPPGRRPAVTVPRLRCPQGRT